MKKIILSLSILILLILSSAIFLPYIFKDQIIETVRNTANKSLKAELHFNKNIGINIFKSFPNLNLSLKDISLCYNEGFYTNDTLFSAKEIEVSFDLMKFYKKQQYVFGSILLDKPFIHLEATSDSINNWDVSSVTDTSTGTPINFELSEIRITDGHFRYLDAISKTDIHLRGITHTSSGNFNSESFLLDAETDITELALIYDGTTYLNRWKINQVGKIDVNLVNNKYALPKNTLTINGLDADLTGFIQLNNDDMIFDLDIHSKTPDLNKFLTLIPAIYTSDFGTMQTKGGGTLNAQFRGVYSKTSFPAYDIAMQVNQGYFKYAELPLPMEDIDLNLHVYSKDGNINQTVIDISKMHFKMGNDPFDLKLHMQDIFGNILLNMGIQGKIDLGNITKIVPLEGTQISGQIDAKIDINGRVNDISASAFEKFEASGFINTQNLGYKTEDMSGNLDLEKATIIVQDHHVNIPVFNGMIGNNDIQFSGKFDNFFAYILADKTLKGDAILISKRLNINDFLMKTEENEGSSKMTLVELPGDINLTLTASIENLIYDDLELTNFNGKVGIENKTIKLQQINTDLLGGSVNLDASYTYDIHKPWANFDFSYSNIKIIDLMRKFNVIKAFVPIFESIQAMTTAKLTMAAELNKDMSPKLESINLGGSLNFQNLVINQLQVLKDIDSKLGTNHFNENQLHDFLVNFKIQNGELVVSPFNVSIDSAKFLLSGVSKLDGSINYNGIFSIPSSYVKDEVSIINNLTAGTQFRDLKLKPNDFLDIAIRIQGSFKKPIIELHLKEIKNSMKQTIKNTVINKLSEKKEDAQQLASDEITKRKEEVLRKASEAKAKLQEELKQKQKEAEGQIRKETAKKKDEVKKQAEDKLKGLFKK